MEFTYPGPHAFIILLTIGRFTQEEKHCVDILSEFFGLSFENSFNSISPLNHSKKFKGKQTKEGVIFKKETRNEKNKNMVEIEIFSLSFSISQSYIKPSVFEKPIFF